jgi:hypothetical protein
MPVKVFGKTYKSHKTAANAAKKKGIAKPDAYIATAERKQKKGKKK